MFTEIVVLLAALLLQYKVHAFLATCVAFVVFGLVNRRSSGDDLRFMRSVGRDLGWALIFCQRVFLASALVVAAAYGFVVGQWGGWLVVVVVGAAVWATWESLTAEGKKLERREPLPRTPAKQA